MKKNKFFALAFAALTLFSCTKENSETTDEKGFSLALKVEQGAYTRAVQTPGATGASINSMIIELFDASKIKIRSEVLTLEQITGAISNDAIDAASRIVLENVDSRTAYVKVWAYQKTAVASVNDLAKGINDYQMEFDVIPFYPVAQTAGTPAELLSTTDDEGFISISKKGNTGTGTHEKHSVWTVQAKLAPYFARFEVAPTVGGVKPDVTSPDGFPAGTQMTVTGIYMNNINDKKDAVNLTCYGGNAAGFGTGDWSAEGLAAFANGGAWSNMNTTSGANTSTTPLTSGTDCYNLFAQAGSPHLVVRVWVDQPDNSIGGDYYGFVTIKDFTITGTGTGKLSAVGVKTGSIYKIDLDAMASLKPDQVNPDPESKSADLYATVEIVDWTIVTATPDLN